MPNIDALSFNTSEDMSQVKVFVMDIGTDMWKGSLRDNNTRPQCHSFT